MIGGYIYIPLRSRNHTYRNSIMGTKALHINIAAFIVRITMKPTIVSHHQFFFFHPSLQTLQQYQSRYIMSAEVPHGLSGDIQLNTSSSFGPQPSATTTSLPQPKSSGGINSGVGLFENVNLLNNSHTGGRKSGSNQHSQVVLEPTAAPMTTMGATAGGGGSNNINNNTNNNHYATTTQEKPHDDGVGDHQSDIKDTIIEFPQHDSEGFVDENDAKSALEEEEKLTTWQKFKKGFKQPKRWVPYAVVLAILLGFLIWFWVSDYKVFKAAAKDSSGRV